jgi:hypothetical protein
VGSGGRIDYAAEVMAQGYYEDNVTLLCLLTMTGNFWDPAAVTGIFTDGFESGDTARWTSFQSPQSSTAGRTAFQIPKMLWHEQVGERDRQLRSRWLRAGNRASNYWQDLPRRAAAKRLRATAIS